MSEPTPEQIEAGRMQAVLYCVRIEDFQMKKIYTAMRALERPSDEAVERVARAICWAFSEETDDCSSVCLNAHRCMAEKVDDSFMRDARAAIAAMPEQSK